MILPIVAHVAAEDPEIAANIADPTTLTCINLPGRGPIHGARPLNIKSEIFDLNKISPIQMNSGSDVSVQLDKEPKIVVAIASPGMRVDPVNMATRATPINAKPIQTPKPSNNNIVPTMTAANNSPDTSPISTDHLLMG